LEITWIDIEEQFDGIVPHSFIDLFDKLLVPELKSLTLTTSQDADPFVLPALTSLAARSEFPLESLHIGMCDPNSSAPFPVDRFVGFLRDLLTLTSLHWNSTGMELPGLVEALIYTANDHTLLPNLFDISLDFDGYDTVRNAVQFINYSSDDDVIFQLLPAFVDMVLSRRSSNRQCLAVTSLRHFHLRTVVPYSVHSVSTTSSVPIKTANEAEVRATFVTSSLRLNAGKIVTLMAFCESS
jgi:hypothetical protein